MARPIRNVKDCMIGPMFSHKPLADLIEQSGLLARAQGVIAFDVASNMKLEVLQSSKSISLLGFLLKSGRSDEFDTGA
ncbi:hypothetical protein [Acidihalobacter ferrooxydans]|uniref:Uncharacterized protein n=1 Tax=Acidihalobacter ferrooxydans TaxID=1765967 RepID=A0A1P8UDL9_9GAMM|nr:hypothetical protein [Acidihalobacter ferrooxydans]APZ41961.1 hypothetical protein BW247_01645 [Acidihalobacter ferrooxydans]